MGNAHATKFLNGHCPTLPMPPFFLMGIAQVCPCPKILPVKQHYLAQLGSTWLNLAQISSTWLNLAQLCSTWLNSAELEFEFFSIRLYTNAFFFVFKDLRPRRQHKHNLWDVWPEKPIFESPKIEEEVERTKKSSFVVNWLPILGTLTNIDTSEVGRR